MFEVFCLFTWICLVGDVLLLTVGFITMKYTTNWENMSQIQVYGGSGNGVLYHPQ